MKAKKVKKVNRRKIIKEWKQRDYQIKNDRVNAKLAYCFRTGTGKRVSKYDQGKILKIFTELFKNG